jgi:hypothetical protein
MKCFLNNTVSIIEISYVFLLNTVFTHVSCMCYSLTLVGRQWCKLYADQLFFFGLCNAEKRYGKGKVFPLHAVMVYRRSKDIAPLILNLCTRWR